ncbi:MULTISPECIES: TetR/AcrR family transcriptional regulator [unclassified Sedimentibacter]|uniref:TetR/AcrR family transcriptional regulator n=1 Tax=unclassified Sedimentibacter TaxID=2649220 RepID=UPI0027DF0CB9|nr:TetR/AcrR family transcriptional regulator [Sedimentibacter sp. MB35-C1]WMJ77494.1 TetR/AcrR family transcriptional regulator [Sedimentibacter sp. MB35-C1]
MKTNITLKKKRVMLYFIESAANIMANEGVDQLTIRNVSERAGYNSATLYNYFDNFDELKEWASIYCITDYLSECCDILAQRIDSLDNLMEIWLTYCRYAFQNPQLYSYIFFSSQSSNIQRNLKIVSEAFPDWLHRDLRNERIEKFVNGPNTEVRSLYLVELCIQDGYFKEEDKIDINNIAGILTAGLLQELYAKGELVNQEMIEAALEKFKKYFGQYIAAKRIR